MFFFGIFIVQGIQEHLYLSSLYQEKLQQFLKFNTKVFYLSSIILLRNQKKKFLFGAVVKMVAILVVFFQT